MSDVIDLIDSDDDIALVQPNQSNDIISIDQEEDQQDIVPNKKRTNITSITITNKRSKSNPIASNTVLPLPSTTASTLSKTKFSKTNDTVTKRLQKELRDVTTSTHSGILANCIDDSDLFKWNAILDGPSDSPYAGGQFHLKIQFPPDYPFKPPHIKFTTQIYHCNISSGGDICLDILKGGLGVVYTEWIQIDYTNLLTCCSTIQYWWLDQWSPALTISKLLLSILSLLTDPNPDSPLNSTAGQLYKRSVKLYEAEALKQTKKYAMSTSADTRTNKRKRK